MTWTLPTRLIAVAANGHQHEIELRGGDGSTQELVAKIDSASGKVEFYLASALEGDPE